MPSKHIAPNSRLLIFLAAALLALVLLGGTAFAAKQYVLKHPTHEHCKAHYVKKTKIIKKHEHGRTVKVHEILCVYVAPRKAPVESPPPVETTPVVPTPSAPTPAPTPPEPVKEPTKPVGPLATTTTLTVSEPEECKAESIGGIGSDNWCLYTVSVNVKSGGTEVTSPSPVFVFTNPATPKTGYTVSGVNSFRIRVSIERIQSTSATSVVINNGPLIGSVSGEEPWSIIATYAGSSEYSASQSTVHKII
jgi:hypothetical protein